MIHHLITATSINKSSLPTTHHTIRPAPLHPFHSTHTIAHSFSQHAIPLTTPVPPARLVLPCAPRSCLCTTPLSALQATLLVTLLVAVSDPPSPIARENAALCACRRYVHDAVTAVTSRRAAGQLLLLTRHTSTTSSTNSTSQPNTHTTRYTATHSRIHHHTITGCQPIAH